MCGVGSASSLALLGLFFVNLHLVTFLVRLQSLLPSVGSIGDFHSYLWIADGAPSFLYMATMCWIFMHWSEWSFWYVVYVVIFCLRYG